MLTPKEWRALPLKERARRAAEEPYARSIPVVIEGPSVRPTATCRACAGPTERSIQMQGIALCTPCATGERRRGPPPAAVLDAAPEPAWDPTLEAPTIPVTPTPGLAWNPAGEGAPAVPATTATAQAPDPEEAAPAPATTATPPPSPVPTPTATTPDIDCEEAPTPIPEEAPAVPTAAPAPVLDPCPVHPERPASRGGVCALCAQLIRGAAKRGRLPDDPSVSLDALRVVDLSGIRRWDCWEQVVELRAALDAGLSPGRRVRPTPEPAPAPSKPMPRPAAPEVEEFTLEDLEDLLAKVMTKAPSGVELEMRTDEELLEAEAWARSELEAQHNKHAQRAPIPKWLEDWFDDQRRRARALAERPGPPAPTPDSIQPGPIMEADDRPYLEASPPPTAEPSQEDLEAAASLLDTARELRAVDPTSLAVAALASLTLEDVTHRYLTQRIAAAIEPHLRRGAAIALDRARDLAWGSGREAPGMSSPAGGK